MTGCARIAVSSASTSKRPVHVEGHPSPPNRSTHTHAPAAATIARRAKAPNASATGGTTVLLPKTELPERETLILIAAKSSPSVETRAARRFPLVKPSADAVAAYGTSVAINRAYVD